MEKLSVEQKKANIEYNLAVIKEKISQAELKAGNENQTKLMAVTKTVEPMFINHAIDCGIDLIGENKVQEFLSKEQYLKLDKASAHIIGHLQTNKVKQIVGKVDMIQSLDSVKLAKEISKQSEKLGVITNCLVEVNVANEMSKSGVAFENAMEFIDEISQIPSIQVQGLMSIPPICENYSQLDKYFSKMHTLFVDIRDKKVDNIKMNILSMGMSCDYEQAILGGANLVRVGSLIFGARIY